MKIMIRTLFWMLVMAAFPALALAADGDAAGGAETAMNAGKAIGAGVAIGAAGLGCGIGMGLTAGKGQNTLVQTVMDAEKRILDLESQDKKLHDAADEGPLMEA